MVKQALLVLVGSLFLLLASSQDCPLPSDSSIVAAIALLLPSGEGGIVFYPNLTGPVKYVCQAQGSRINTYKFISMIGTFTPDPGEPEVTRLFQMQCSDGVWRGDANAMLVPPPASIINAPVRTDCYKCKRSFGIDTCRECDSACNTGLERCTGYRSDDCCLVFSIDGECSDDCSSSGVNYVASEETGFNCTCNKTCPDGFTIDSTCTNCTKDEVSSTYITSSHFSSSLIASSTFLLSSSFFSSSFVMSSSSLIPSPSPIPCAINISNCMGCVWEFSCCNQCSEGYTVFNCLCAQTASNQFNFLFLFLVIPFFIAIPIALVHIMIIIKRTRLKKVAV